MSNSFRVGSISAAMNFSTGGFMQGVREVVNATGGMRSAMGSVGRDTAVATAAMSTGLKAVATQAGLTSGTMGLLGKQVGAMAVAANLSVAGMIARFVALRNQAVITARELDKTNAASNANRGRLLNTDARITSGVLSTGNEAAAMSALQASYTGIAATAGKAALGIGAVAVAGVLVAKALKPAIDASLEFEHSFAFVRKTVDGTKEQLDAMAESIRAMSLVVPISVTELNGVAAAAGQLGIAREDVVDFTRVMAEMGVATDLTAEQAAVGFAQWANITGMASDDVDNLTSAVVHLGNTTATTESAILNMGLRLAGASRVVGVTNAEMAGLSASLSSLGIWAESGGNAMSRTMYDMQKAVSSGSDELKLFAAVAGKSADEFSAQFKSAPMSAIVDFVGGIAAAGKDANSVLEQLGITEMESQRAIIGLAGGHDKLARNIRESTSAYAENNARSKEANTLFGTGISQTQLLKNASHNLAIEVGNVLAPTYDSLIGTMTSVFNLMTKVAVKYRETIALQGQAAGQEALFTPGAWGMPAEAKKSFSEDDLLRETMKIQKAGFVVRETTVDLERMNKAFAMDKYKEDIAGMKDLVPTDVFRRAADSAVAIFKAVPEAITTEMRSAKFADMYRDSREGFKSVADAAKMIPKEYQAEFISAANIVEAELAKKGKSGGRKLADEAGKEFERAMEEAVKFRLDLYPAESFAEDVRKITTMAQTFPETMTGDAVGKAFDKLLTDFEGKGVNAVKAIKDNIIGIAPQFAKEMEESVARAATASLEALMEVKAGTQRDGNLDSVGRGIELSDRLTGSGVAKGAAQDIADLKEAGRLDGETMNLLAVGYWESIKGYSDAAIQGIMLSVDAIAPSLGKAIKQIQEKTQFQKTTDAFKAMGEVAANTSAKLRDLGAKGLANVFSMISKVTSIGIGMADTISAMPDLFKKFADGATSSAIKVATAMHIALNVIALIADAVALVLELFGAWGDQGVKELKGMAKVIDEIKQASNQWADSLTDKLVDAIKTGQFAWRDFVNEILDDILRIATRQLIVGPLMDFAGSVIPFADGGAFEKGHVVRSPEIFNTKSGPAVRGEAGTEVVMPAVRLRDGTLGVKGAGGGSAAPIINIHDNRRGNDPPIEVTHQQMPDGQMVYDIVVNAWNKAAMLGDIDMGMRAQMRRGHT